MRKAMWLFLCAALTLIMPICARAAEAVDITAGCDIYAPPSEGGFTPDTSAASDGNTETSLRVGEDGYIEISLRDRSARYLYILWEKQPCEWRLMCAVGESFEQCGIYGVDGFLQECAELPEGTAAVRLVPAGDGGLSVLEIQVFSEGELPDSVHCWDKTPRECELMVIAAHQDDELLFFGGTIPYYAGERGYDTAVVYMTDCGAHRQQEALNGLWKCGLRQYPVFLNLPDRKTDNVAAAMRDWDVKQVAAMLEAEITSRRPQVIVSHDVAGEYGHGQHMLTVTCLAEAIDSAADAAEPWIVPKCYLHLYNRREIYIDWTGIELERMGMTAAQAASLGYGEHTSQHKYYSDIFLDEYDCRSYGLYCTSVGEDAVGNDFFENITPRIENAAPTEPPDEGFERYGSSGCVYRGGSSDAAVYVRYGRVGGRMGWYLCDDTGSLLYGENGKPQRYKKGAHTEQQTAATTAAPTTAETYAQSDEAEPDGILTQLGNEPAAVKVLLAAMALTAAALSAALAAAVARARRQMNNRK